MVPSGVPRVTMTGLDGGGGDVADANDSRELTRRRFIGGGTTLLGGLTVGPTIFSIAGCHRGATSTGPVVTGHDGAPDAGLDGAVVEHADALAEAVVVPPPPIVDPRANEDVRLDLIEHLHLADVQHGGTFIDFGTPARAKYTLGNWRSGWGADEAADGLRFTWAGASPGRLYFHLDEPSALRIELRVRGRSSDRISLYANDHAIDRVDIPRRWSTQVIEIDRGRTNAGENSLKLVHRSTSNTGRGFAIDFLRITPSGTDHHVAALPRAAELITMAELGGQRRPALTLTSPTRLSWFVELPDAPRLVFSLGAASSAATAIVRVTAAETGEARDLHRGEVSPNDGWVNVNLDLTPEAGQVVRLDLEVEGGVDQAGSSPDGGVDAPPVLSFATPAIVTRRVVVEAGDDPPPRHVIMLLIDTLRADKLSAYGRTRVQSPEMDSFVTGSTLFERCQAPANWTKPSCASLLTGVHPPTHGALTEGNSLPGRINMVSETFQAAGFRTAAMIANGYLASDFGFDRGWDLYRNYIRERLPTEAEHVFEEATGWLERNREHRMFAYIQTIDPHVPYDPPAEDLRLYDPDPYSGPIRNRSTGFLLDDFKRDRVQLNTRDRRHLEALYDGEVTYHDRHFGRFVARLAELGILDETLFVVTSDHGEEFFERGSVGHGHSLYQELLHVPLILRSPNHIPAGRRLGQVCSLVDIAPTLLEATGLEIPEAMEGRSLMPDLRGAPPPMGAAAFSSQWDTGNHRELSWTARLGDWKLRMRGPAISYLYDLSADAQEQSDVDRRYPIALRAARIALGQFLGAESRRHWSAAVAPRRRRPAAPATPPTAEDATMTPELCEQLQALGYFPDGCQ